MTSSDGPPFRLPIPWEEETFWDNQSLDDELRRVFDICHSCRRCFNLCTVFPTLFDLIDESHNGEVEDLKSTEFPKIVEGCTLCDLCFMTKCPYVPPHPWNVDFPHLMLRARAVEYKEKGTPWAPKELAETDRNGKILSAIAPLANWATHNSTARDILEKTTQLNKTAALPPIAHTTFMTWLSQTNISINQNAPAFGMKAVLYVTCFGNYNNTQIAEAALRVLAHNGVQTQVVYFGCCGMPRLEQAELSDVAARAQRIARELEPLIDQHLPIIPLLPSCTLMMKQEWPLLLPNDRAVQKLAGVTLDLMEFLAQLNRTKGLTEGLNFEDTRIAVHHACHARAQAIGPQAADLLSQLPGSPEIISIERCSGHGGTWGLFHFEEAVRQARPAVRQLSQSDASLYVSECPLAAKHLTQVAQMEGDPLIVEHPILLLAQAYGLMKHRI